MAFCKKCGALIAFAGGNCPRCGQQSSIGAAGRDTVMSAGNGFAKDVTIGKLERYRQLIGECDELQTMIKPQSSFPSSLDTSFKKKSFMSYFWPFMVGGIIGGYAVYMVASFIVALSSVNLVIDSQEAASRLLGDSFAGIIVALIVAGAIIFFGVKVAKRKQADFNSNAEFMNKEAEARYNKGQENQRMIALMQQNTTEMRKYESLVPEGYRTYDKLGAIIDLMKEDKAQTVEEAIALL